MQNRNPLRKVFFDNVLKEDLQILATREGLISPLPSEISDGEEHFKDSQLVKVFNKKKIIRSVLLFDEIDMSTTLFDWNLFIQAGIVSPNAAMLNVNLDVDSMGRHPFGESIYPGFDRQLYLHSKIEAERLLSILKNSFIKYHLKESRHRDVFPNMNISEERKNFKKLLRLASLEKHLNADPRFESNLLGVLWSFQEGLYYSLKEQITFMSGLGNTSQSQILNDCKVIDDLYYIIQTNLSDIIAIFPDPPNLTEALRLREKKEMVRLRKLISLWIITLRTEGPSRMEENIRRDIKLASQEMKFVNHWRDFNNQPFVFWMILIGSWIPGLSKVLKIVNMANKLAARHAEASASWVSILENKKSNK